jgi:hypothetical protein
VSAAETFWDQGRFRSISALEEEGLSGISGIVKAAVGGLTDVNVYQEENVVCRCDFVLVSEK